MNSGLRTSAECFVSPQSHIYERISLQCIHLKLNYIQISVDCSAVFKNRDICSAHKWFTIWLKILYKLKCHPFMAASRYGCFPLCYFPLWLIPVTATSSYGYFPLWLIPVMATSRHDYFQLWLLPVMATSHYGHFPLWLLCISVMATSRYGYFVFPLWLYCTH